MDERLFSLARSAVWRSVFCISPQPQNHFSGLVSPANKALSSHFSARTHALLWWVGWETWRTTATMEAATTGESTNHTHTRNCSLHTAIAPCIYFFAFFPTRRPQKARLHSTPEVPPFNTLSTAAHDTIVRRALCDMHMLFAWRGEGRGSA